MVKLREFSVLDGQDKLEFLKRADFEARGFKITGVFDEVENLEQFRRRIVELNGEALRNLAERQFYWVMKDGEPIGVMTLRREPDEFWLKNAGHIGIAIDKPYRGRGYGTEALREMCKKAALGYGLREMVVMALTDNVASRKMIEKAGGKYQEAVVAVDGERLAKYIIGSVDEV